MKAIGFKSTTDLVKWMLEQYPETRNSDSVLYVKVCQRINNRIIGRDFAFVMNNLKQFGLPTFDTVGRCRRKIQEQNPELAADAEVEAGRAVREDEFRDYARKVNI